MWTVLFDPAHPEHDTIGPDEAVYRKSLVRRPASSLHDPVIQTGALFGSRPGPHQFIF
jgi:hypothetical protein